MRPQKGKLRKKLSTLRAEATLKALHKAIASVQKVKTLWRIDKEVKLSTFYYPSKVIIDGDAKNIEVMGLPSRRGPAAEAKLQYREAAESVERRAKLRERHRFPDASRPQP